MLRTNGFLTLSFFLCISFFNLTLSQADSSSTISKNEIVNRQLDEVSQEFPNMQPDAEKVFSNMQPDAERTFSNTPALAERKSSQAQPERQDAGAMLTEVLSPDLPGTTKPKTPSKVPTRVHTLDTGTEFFYYQYREPSAGVKIRGPMYGYYLNYAYRPADPNFFNNFLTSVYSLQIRYATSRDLEYKGSGVDKGEHDDAMEFRGLIGKDYFIGNDSRVTPYFGFGYRYLLDRGDGRHSNTGQYGYDRKSHYYYLPLGGDVVIDLPKNYEVDLNAEYDIFLQGWQKSYFSDGDQFTGFNNPDVVNHQDRGFGVRGSIRFMKHGPRMDFYVEPYVRYWNIEDSKVGEATIDGEDGFGLEPANTTIEMGSKFGVQF